MRHRPSPPGPSACPGPWRSSGHNSGDLTDAQLLDLGRHAPHQSGGGVRSSGGGAAGPVLPPGRGSLGDDADDIQAVGSGAADIETNGHG